MKKVSCWHDRKRDCVSSNVAFVLASAEAGEVIEFQRYTDPILDKISVVLAESSKKLYGSEA